MTFLKIWIIVPALTVLRNKWYEFTKCSWSSRFPLVATLWSEHRSSHLRWKENLQAMLYTEFRVIFIKKHKTDHATSQLPALWCLTSCCSWDKTWLPHHGPWGSAGFLYAPSSQLSESQPDWLAFSFSKTCAALPAALCIGWCSSWDVSHSPPIHPSFSFPSLLAQLGVYSSAQSRSELLFQLS